MTQDRKLQRPIEKTLMTEDMKKLCRDPFPAEAYSQHPTKTFLTTLKAFYVTERLNEVFGMGRWSIEVEVIERTADYVLMQGEFHSLDYLAFVPKQFGGHMTTGKNTEIADGYKSALTDCQSKIASYFEIGADMFKGKINPGKDANSKNMRQADDRPWLNDVKRGTTEKTKEWVQIEAYIDNGTIKAVDQITKFRLSKKVEALLVELIEGKSKTK